MSIHSSLAIITDLKTKSIFEKFVLLLIFLFPVLSLSVRHWLSGIFSITALISLIVLFRRPQQLYKEEKILFLFFVLLLISFLFSATLNGWSDSSIRRLGTVSKYLTFFPIYLLLRQFKDLSSFLFIGIVIGGVVLGLQALIDVFYKGLEQGWGIYGPIIFGDLSILFFSITLILLFFSSGHSKTTYLLILSLILTALAVFLSGSRNAWIASLFSLVAVPLLCYKFIKYKRAILVVLPILLITASASLFTDSMQTRLSLAISEINTYITKGAPSDIPIKENSAAFRLEQWRVALHITHDAFLFGYGGGNAGKQVGYYAEKGLAHPDLINPDNEKGIGGLHSTYFDALINEGIIGLVILLAFLLYPIYVFFKTRNINPLISTIGIIFITNYMIFGVSENPFVHDNFSSVYLILLSVFFSEVIRNKYNVDSLNTTKF